MNKIYRIVWSPVQNAFVVVSELARRVGKSSSRDARCVKHGRRAEQATVRNALAESIESRACLATVLLVISGVVLADPAATALPTGGQIAAGSGAISQSGSALTVQQHSDRLITNWQRFDIGSQASVTFDQPSASSIALNRVLGQDPSQIMGQLNANGQVMLVNPAGVVFGAGSQVNVGGITATTLDISDADFLAGRYRFSDSGQAGTVENFGRLFADGGVVALIAPLVRNVGDIQTPNGSTVLAAAEAVTLDFTGDGLVSVTVDRGTLDALVANNGAVRADDGVVILTAGSARAALRCGQQQRHRRGARSYRAGRAHPARRRQHRAHRHIGCQ